MVARCPLHCTSNTIHLTRTRLTGFATAARSSGRTPPSSRDLPTTCVIRPSRWAATSPLWEQRWTRWGCWCVRVAPSRRTSWSSRCVAFHHPPRLSSLGEPVRWKTQRHAVEVMCKCRVCAFMRAADVRFRLPPPLRHTHTRTHTHTCLPLQRRPSSAFGYSAHTPASPVRRLERNCDVSCGGTVMLCTLGVKHGTYHVCLTRRCCPRSGMV
jgi:hypothetical protein